MSEYKISKELKHELLKLCEWCVQNDADGGEIEMGSKCGKIKVKINFEFELNEVV